MSDEKETPNPFGNRDIAGIIRAGLESRKAVEERAKVIAALDGGTKTDVSIAKTSKPKFDGLKVRGRGFVEPYIKTLAGEEGLSIRVDCAVRDEEWFELVITAADLCELLGGVLASQPRGYSNVVMMLDRVQEDLRS